MKRFILLLLCAISINVAMAQDEVAPEYVVEDDSVKMSRIIEDTGLSIQEAHDRVFLHLAQAFNDANNTCKMDSPSQLFYRGIFSDVAVFNVGLGVLWKYSVSFDLNISVKENRVRVVVSVSGASMSSGPGVYYRFVDAYPITPEHDAYETGVKKKHAEEIFANTLVYMQSLIDGIENSLINTDDEDW